MDHQGALHIHPLIAPPATVLMMEFISSKLLYPSPHCGTISSNDVHHTELHEYRVRWGAGSHSLFMFSDIAPETGYRVRKIPRIEIL